MIITVEDCSSGTTSKVDVSTATVLIDVARDLFGSGILTNPDGVVMSVESKLVEGIYKWTAKAVGEKRILHINNITFDELEVNFLSISGRWRYSRRFCWWGSCFARVHRCHIGCSPMTQIVVHSHGLGITPHACPVFIGLMTQLSIA